ncbi:PREDICTED: uncharacterized protein LOC105556562 [Vollenhovia emeryi]|uniref:uncharacterized protein LOC105556562 n=1 Tax=Vollenhovia emeryi TaxID=411798 RepID=UPI0005F3B4A9|nr:PREDICTED: uncharacterized protein LOC105556562 [Vollenhovia emeryi]
MAPRCQVDRSRPRQQRSCRQSPLILPQLSVYNGPEGTEGRSWAHAAGLELADPDFTGQDPVELLLGAEAYASIVLPELRRGGPSEPVAQRTHLGWILLGAVGPKHAASVVTSLQCSVADDLPSLVRRFWEWEEAPSADVPLSTDEQACENHFIQTHQRLADGRFQVRLPLRRELPDLSTTRRAASHMLDVMQRRFGRDPAFRDRFRNFMAEYLSLGHMSPSASLSVASDTRSCYLPHHGVM